MTITPDTTYTVPKNATDNNLAFHGSLVDGVATTILISLNTPTVWEFLKRTADAEVWFIIDWDGTQDIATTKEGAHVLPAAISARSVSTKSTETYIRILAVGAAVDYSLTLIV